MRTTRNNEGKGDIKDRKMSTRTDKARPAAGPTKRSSPSSTDKARPAYQGRPSEQARTSAPTRTGSGKTSFGKPERSRPLSGRPAAGKLAPAKPEKSFGPGGAKPVRTTEAPRETDFLSGRNPVMEALRSGRPISKMYIAAGEHQGSIREIIALAKEKGIPVQIAEATRLDAMSLGVRNQGVVAMVSPVAYSTIDEIIALAETKTEKPCLILLDQLKDPQNLGAVLRTADAAGAHGVLIPQRRSCQLSAAVAKASAGAIEYVKVAQIGNVAKTLEDLKKQGFWVVGADPERGTSYHDVDLTGPVVIVIGDEGEGMARLTKERCDSLVRIPMKGKVQSLNASVASAIILYEMIRQRDAMAAPQGPSRLD